MAEVNIKKNAVLNTIKTISGIIFPLITFPYVSRVLLPENVGKINFGSSIVSYFSLAASLGISTYAIRECSFVKQNKEKLSNTASQIFSINVITTIISYIGLAITLIFFNKLDNYRNLIILQSLSIAAVTLGADWLNSAMEDFRYITIRTISFQFISLLLMFLLVHKPQDYMKYVIISLISSAGANISNICYRRRYCTVKFITDIKTGIEWKKHIVPILFLFVMILAQTLFNSVDVTMIGLFHGDREVGIYSTAHKVANLIAQVIVSSAWVVMPRMSGYFAERNYDEINSLLSKIMSVFALIGLPCIVGTIGVSHEVIYIIAGREYADAGLVLQILMTGYIFDLFGNSFIGNIICLPLKQEKKYTIIWIIASALNMLLNYILIPFYGASAAAGTTAVSYFVSLILLVVFIDKKINIKNKVEILLSPCIGSLCIIVICLLLNTMTNIILRLILKVVVSVIVYCVIQFLLRNKQFTEIIDSFQKILRRRSR